MKKTLFALLLIANTTRAQDSLVLEPKYFLSTRPGQIDAEMIYEPWRSVGSVDAKDSGLSWLACKWKDATLFGPKLVWQECPGADSVAVYLAAEDTLSVMLYAGRSQSNTTALLDLRGPSRWQRHVVALPKGYQVLGITLPPYDFAHTDNSNELGARCYLGRCTVYYPAKASVAETHIGDANEMIYYDLLGRVTKPSGAVKRLARNKFLVLQ